MIKYFRALMARSRHDGQSDNGASGVEYGLLIAAVAAVIVVLAFSVGSFVHDGFKTTCDALKSQDTTNAAPCP